MCLKINWSVKTPLQRTGMGVARSGVWASGSGQFVYHHSGNKHGVNRPTYKKRVKSPKYAFGNSRCFSKYLKNVWIADRIDRNIKPLFMRKIVNKNAKFRQLLAFTINVHSTIHLTYAAKKKIKFMFCTDKKNGVDTDNLFFNSSWRWRQRDWLFIKCLIPFRIMMKSLLEEISYFPWLFTRWG